MGIMKTLKIARGTLSIILILAVSFLALGQALAAGSATLSISPSSGSYKKGSDFSIVVHANSGSAAVNAIEVGLSYNTSLIDYVSASIPDTFGFNKNITQVGTPICITVATLGSTMTGDQTVATVNFRAKAAGTVNFSFINSANTCYNGSPGSSILDASNQQNLWNGQTSAGSITITDPTTTTTGGGTTTTTTTTSTPTTTTTSTPRTTTGTTTPTSNTSATTPALNATTSGYMVAIKVVGEDNQIVAGAKVTMDDKFTAVSDTTGIAGFTNVSLGSHTVKMTVKGKTLSQIIDVKGVSTAAPQEYAFKAVAKASNTRQYIIIAAGVIILLMILLIIKRPKKPRDYHMNGATITPGYSNTSGPSAASSIAPTPMPLHQPPNVGMVVEPTTINNRADTPAINNQIKQGSSNGQF